MSRRPLRFLRDGDRASVFVRHFLPFSEDQQSRLIKQTSGLIYSGLTATLVIACAQGCLGGVSLPSSGSRRRFSGVGVIGMLDNILRPVLLRGKVAMNGLLLFLSILGGLASFGFIGLILGPVVMAAAVSLMGMLKTGKRKLRVSNKELNDGHGN